METRYYLSAMYASLPAFAIAPQGRANRFGGPPAYEGTPKRSGRYTKRRSPRAAHYNARGHRPR